MFLFFTFSSSGAADFHNNNLFIGTTWLRLSPSKVIHFWFFLKKVGTFQNTLQNPSYGVGSQSGVTRGLWHLQTHNHPMCETTFCTYCASSYLRLLDTTDRKWIYTHSKSEGSKIKWRANKEVRNQVFHYEKCKSWEWHMVIHNVGVATYGHRMQGVTWRLERRRFCSFLKKSKKTPKTIYRKHCSLEYLMIYT